MFIFLILVFLSTQRQSFALKELSHVSKIDFVGALLSRYFEEQGATSSIYVSTPKYLALIVCCQSSISFSELWKSTIKFIIFSN